MNSAVLLLIPVFVPLALALGLLVRPSLFLPASPWAAAPALLVALTAGPQPFANVDALLLGGLFHLDLTGQVFLILTSALWLCAGLFAKDHFSDPGERGRFYFFFLVTMTGNLGLSVSMDLSSFYLFYALMTFSAYGLIVHDRRSESLRAGRVYLIMALAGEMAILTGFWLAASTADSLRIDHLAEAVIHSPLKTWIVSLFLLGFGVKAGVLPLHFWLPLAHPAAPSPASSVLSGVMIKAGLLGWVRFLPLGAMALPVTGSIALTVGLAMALFGVLAGLTQRNPKTVLAYSSISQMGFPVMALGLGLVHPELWSLLLSAIFIFILHHGFVKGALFLGVGFLQKASLNQSQLILIGLGALALSLAGAPFTSGSVAKEALKETFLLSPLQWPLDLTWVWLLLSFGTSVLMGRLLLLLASDLKNRSKIGEKWSLMMLGFGGLFLASLFGVWTIPSHLGLEAFPSISWSLAYALSSLLPLLLAAILFWAVPWLRQEPSPKGSRPFEKLFIWEKYYINQVLTSISLMQEKLLLLKPFLLGVLLKLGLLSLELLVSCEKRLYRWTAFNALFALLVLLFWLSL